jgi:hypothetical protein
MELQCDGVVVYTTILGAVTYVSVVRKIPVIFADEANHTFHAQVGIMSRKHGEAYAKRA